MQATETLLFWLAVKQSDWTTVLSEGQRLIVSVEGEAQVDLAVHVCLALEHLGKWMMLADAAEAGIAACNRHEVYDQRYAGLLKSLGRGYWDRQLYTKAMATYGKLGDWATVHSEEGERYAARFSMACCLEKTQDGGWAKAADMFADVFQHAPDWPHRVASAVNEVSIWMRRGDVDAAYDVATTRLLAIPAEGRRGGAWAEFLRVLAELEVYRGRPEVAAVAIEDALEMIPDGRYASLARCHAVRALVEDALGNEAEASDAISLAWVCAESAPNADTCRLLREVEAKLGGG